MQNEISEKMFFPITKMTKEQKKIVKEKREELGVGNYRYKRCRYDWKVYSTEDRLVLEQFWSELTLSFANLLPARFRTEPKENLLGCNFGTGNGAIQKGWAKQKYQMFGVEFLAEPAEELSEYGLKGILASFYNLQEIEDESFDFGIVDRCMFNGKYSKLEGPHFDEIFRTIKRDGALIGLLYASWSEVAMLELAAEGEFNYRLTKSKNHPLLAFSVDRSKPPTKFPDLADEVSSLSNCSLLNQYMVTDNLYQIKYENGVHHFLFIPTNEIIEVKEKNGRYSITAKAYADEYVGGGDSRSNGKGAADSMWPSLSL